MYVCVFVCSYAASNERGVNTHLSFRMILWLVSYYEFFDKNVRIIRALHSQNHYVCVCVCVGGVSVVVQHSGRSGAGGVSA